MRHRELYPEDGSIAPAKTLVQRPRNCPMRYTKSPLQIQTIDNNITTPDPERPAVLSTALVKDAMRPSDSTPPELITTNT